MHIHEYSQYTKFSHKLYTLKDKVNDTMSVEKIQSRLYQQVLIWKTITITTFYKLNLNIACQVKQVTSTLATKT